MQRQPITLLCITALFAGHFIVQESTSNQEAANSREVRVRSLILEDDFGREIASLRAENGRPVLILRNSDGTGEARVTPTIISFFSGEVPLAILGSDDLETGTLTLGDPIGSGGLVAMGGPSSSTVHSNGGEGAHKFDLTATPDQASITLYDASKYPVIKALSIDEEAAKYLSEAHSPFGSLVPQLLLGDFEDQSLIQLSNKEGGILHTLK